MRVKRGNEDIRTAVATLKDGGIVVYPTETAYALGCDATNARAVRKIFRIKGRSAVKSLPLIVASRRMAEQRARFGSVEKKLAKKHWPGALTIVVNLKSQISKLKNTNQKSKLLASGVVAPDRTIAMRVSSHPIARALSRALGRPIVATSANKSGDAAAYTVTEALQSLGVGTLRTYELSTNATKKRQRYVGHQESIDAVIDAGRLPRRKTSTVVRIDEGRVKILRQGAIILTPSP